MQFKRHEIQKPRSPSESKRAKQNRDERKILHRDIPVIYSDGAGFFKNVFFLHCFCVLSHLCVRHRFWFLYSF